MRKVFYISLFVILIDQITKFYVKTHFHLGEDFSVFGWFKIVYVENPGIAYGMTFGGLTGKIILTSLRIALIAGIIYYIYQWSKKISNNYFLIASALILAGALGNVIDCSFYGVIFNSGTTWNKDLQSWVGYNGISKANFEGYSSLLAGSVVDMLYFPLFDFYWPKWIPIIGGNRFIFFQPVFNIADTAISIGAAVLFIFRKKAFRTKNGVSLKF